MGWGAREHCSQPDPGWTPCLALRDPAQVQHSPASCGTQPSRTRSRGVVRLRVGRQQWECSCKTLFWREAPS